MKSQEWLLLAHQISIIKTMLKTMMTPGTLWSCAYLWLSNRNTSIQKILNFVCFTFHSVNNSFCRDQTVSDLTQNTEKQLIWDLITMHTRQPWSILWKWHSIVREVAQVNMYNFCYYTIKLAHQLFSLSWHSYSEYNHVEENLQSYVWNVKLFKCDQMWELFY